MSIKENNFHHSISPDKVIRGNQAWKEGKKLIPHYCKSPLLLGRSKTTKKIRKVIKNDLQLLGIKPLEAELKYDCCEEDIKRISNIALQSNCDGIVTTGGGKVLDAGKLIAENLSFPCITIPLSAATCAGWTALSNIYSPKGAFINDKVLNNCPKLLIFDYNFVRLAPRRTLASGIADGLAKWYEASLINKSSSDGFVQQAVQMARILRDQLFIDGEIAMNNINSDEWVRVAEACALTAGLIGGIGGTSCRTALAHPIHNGLTQLNTSKKFLHGELVGFGIIVQLQIEELLSENQLAYQAKNQLIKFLIKLNLPTSISSLGLEKISKYDIKEICKFIFNENNKTQDLPFEINEKLLYDAITKTNCDNIQMKVINTK